jgi:hypothetical protein
VLFSILVFPRDRFEGLLAVVAHAESRRVTLNDDNVVGQSGVNGRANLPLDLGIKCVEILVLLGDKRDSHLEDG